MEEVFHPRSERNLALAEYLARKQGAAEDVSTYISAKHALWLASLNGSPEQDIDSYIEEATAGLYCVPVKRNV